MADNPIKSLCLEKTGKPVVLQGNIAFAVGCVRAGIHGADGYPGTPSTEVIDRGLSQVQDMIRVGWSVNEAVAAGVAFGHTLAGADAVVTMKIPGLFQAGDIFTSSAFFHQTRGALIYFIASDFTPSSTQHIIDPRYLFKSCMIPVFEPANHQQMHEAAEIAADIGRTFNTQVVILAAGSLCHSEGLVCLTPINQRKMLDIPEKLSVFNSLPPMARNNYNTVMTKRMQGLSEMVETSELNHWSKGSGKVGVITYGVNTIFAQEIRSIHKADFDILSLGFSNPLPHGLIRRFVDAIDGPVYIFEDGYRFVQEALEQMGITAIGKEPFSPVTEWSPELIAEKMGFSISHTVNTLPPIPRPPMICAGCPYRLFGEAVAKLKKRGKLAVSFGDIGCNSLLYFLGALDTGLAMGASESKRQGFVIARSDMTTRCLSILGDSTECHSGLDATRNAVFRNIPGVKVVLDNYWTAMTGGQPAPTSPTNLAGQPISFNLVKTLEANGNQVLVVRSDDRKQISKTLKQAFTFADEGKFAVVVIQGGCVKKAPNSSKKIRLRIDQGKCDRCHTCLICPGIEKGEDDFPRYTNLCSGCAGLQPSCMQVCPFDAMTVLDEKDRPIAPMQTFTEPPAIKPVTISRDAMPERLSLAIRGVGGQGNLFFGRVLTQLAFLAGYDAENIVKGETHGMAQMGGPVISTFACGHVYSPVLFPGNADCLIVMEKSEILRPGFMDLLKIDGTVLMANTQIVPQTITADQYPDMNKVKSELRTVRLIELDVLAKSMELGDLTGRTANVVMLGALSRTTPFDLFPEELWLEAIRMINPKPAVWAANHAAFKAGSIMLQ